MALTTFLLLLSVAAITSNGAAASVLRRAPDDFTGDTIWCDGLWAGCGNLCPADAPHFETRRSCTLNGQPAVEYWCCYD
ncbi:hypothetical protein BDN67DRAFT_964399 [Paxillus ammoniavirescens]|nr:hypothetical protein BDN67DRAFT_964399 [Paxillus ammoniavirescens]